MSTTRKRLLLTVLLVAIGAATAAEARGPFEQGAAGFGHSETSGWCRPRNVAGQEAFARLAQFVAGGEDGDARAAIDGGGGQSHCRQDIG